MGRSGVRTRALGAIASIHVFALFSSTIASASPSAKLVYVRGTGAQACPSESELRQAVALRLGYDPFFPTASKTVITQLRRDDARRAYLGAIQIVDDDGNVRGSRELASSGDDCAELVRAVALAVSLALDDLDDATKAPSEEDTEPTPSEDPATGEGEDARDLPAKLDREGDGPDDSKSTRASGTEATSRSKSSGDTALLASVGPTLSFGTAPAAAFGGSVSASIRRGIVGLRVDVRGEALSSAPIEPRGRVRTSTVIGTLAGCLYATIPFACLGAGAGGLWSTTDRISSPAEDSAFTATAIARIGADLPIGDVLYLEPFVDGGVHLIRHTVVVNGADVFRVPPFHATAGIHAGGRFF